MEAITNERVSDLSTRCRPAFHMSHCRCWDTHNLTTFSRVWDSPFFTSPQKRAFFIGTWWESTRVLEKPISSLGGGTANSISWVMELTGERMETQVVIALENISRVEHRLELGIPTHSRWHRLLALVLQTRDLGLTSWWVPDPIRRCLKVRSNMHRCRT